MFYQPDRLQSGLPPAQSQGHKYKRKCLLLSFQPSPPYHWQDLSGQSTLHWRGNTTLIVEYRQIQPSKKVLSLCMCLEAFILIKNALHTG